MVSDTIKKVAVTSYIVLILVVMEYGLRLSTALSIAERLYMMS